MTFAYFRNVNGLHPYLLCAFHVPHVQRNWFCPVGQWGTQNITFYKLILLSESYNSRYKYKPIYRIILYEHILFLCLSTMQKECGGRTPRIHDFSKRLCWVVSFKLSPIYPQRQRPCVNFSWECVDPGRIWTQQYWNKLHLMVIEPGVSHLTEWSTSSHIRMLEHTL